MPLYNPYLENDFAPVDEEKLPLPSLKELLNLGKMAKSFLPEPSDKEQQDDSEGGGILGSLGGLVKKFHLDDLETGDILLLIILIYLMIEGDDKLELAITLGVLLVMWLAEKKDED